MKSFRILAGVAGILGVAMAACGPSSGELPEASILPVCVPGQAQTCVGPGGCSGTQLCSADGESFESCICGASHADGGDEAATDGATADGAPDAASDAALAASCVSASIGPAGGQVTHPSGAHILVPSGALALATTLSLCPETEAVPGALGPAFEAGPAGQTFLRPVEVALPYDASRIPVGADQSAVQLWMAPEGSSTFDALQSHGALGIASAATTHFSRFAPIVSVAPVFVTSAPSLTNATAATPYAQQLAAQGGTPPYSWSLPAGSAAPAGLSLGTGGLLQGTPTLASNYAFLVGVSDSAGAAVEMAVTLTVLPASNGVPSAVATNPSALPQGSGDSVVTVSGVGIAPNAVVLWDGVPLASTFLGATQIAASIPAVDLAADGTHQVSITNPTPGGGTSGGIAFAVTPGPVNPAPTIASIAPAQVAPSTSDVPITIAGTNFVVTSSVVVDTHPVATTEVSSSELTAVVPAAFLGGPAALTVSVVNPAPGGGVASGELQVGTPTIAPNPAIQSLSPASAAPGSSGLTIAIAGTNFAPGSLAVFGTVALATTFVSSSELTAVVPQRLLAISGGYGVTVIVPGGEQSSAASFVVGSPGDDAGLDASAANDAGDATVGDGGSQNDAAAGDATTAGDGGAGDATTAGDDGTADATASGDHGAADATATGDDGAWADAASTDDGTWADAASTDDGAWADAASTDDATTDDASATDGAPSQGCTDDAQCAAGLSCGPNPSCSSSPCDPQWTCQ